MTGFRFTLRFRADNEAERRAAEHLKSLKHGEQNRFLVGAVLSALGNNTVASPDCVRQIIREELPSRDSVYALMKRCGMPLTPEDLGLSRKDTVDALLGSREIRDKYLTSSLLWDLGLLDETAERLGGFPIAGR